MPNSRGSLCAISVKLSGSTHRLPTRKILLNIYAAGLILVDTLP